MLSYQQPGSLSGGVGYWGRQLPWYPSYKETMIKRLSLILGLIIALSTILGLLWQLDSRWAKAADVAALSIRLEQKIAADRMDNIQQRIWKLEDRYGKEEKMQGEIKDEYRSLKLELKKLEEQGEK